MSRSDTAENWPWGESAPTSVRPIPSWIAPRSSQGASVTGSPSFPPVPTMPPLAPLSGLTALSPSMPPPDGVHDYFEAAPRSERIAVRMPSLAAPAGPDARDEEIAALREEVETLRAKLGEAAAALANVRRDVVEAAEPQVVRLATMIGERVVARELRADPSLYVTWARAGLEALASFGEYAVAVAPDVALAIPPDAWAAALSGPHRIEVDPSLGRGECELRDGAKAVAFGPAERLREIFDALGVEAS